MTSCVSFFKVIQHVTTHSLHPHTPGASSQVQDMPYVTSCHCLPCAPTATPYAPPLSHPTCAHFHALCVPTVMPYMPPPSHPVCPYHHAPHAPTIIPHMPPPLHPTCLHYHALCALTVVSVTPPLLHALYTSMDPSTAMPPTPLSMAIPPLHLALTSLSCLGLVLPVSVAPASPLSHMMPLAPTLPLSLAQAVQHPAMPLS